ncbi:lipocalin family protein [bacterium]|nr:lipocalin family protein [bacterium]RQV92119.1 MAG: hypothetical protein EH221_12425 [bacterium]
MLSCVIFLIGDDGRDQNEPITVDMVDLGRYVGLWYEIAKIPNRFQRQCERNTTAQYMLREDGKIDVVNRCVDENGEMVEAKGIAKIVDGVSNAKLKVSFVRLLGISLFWGDYWIIGLDENYQYAVVGTPDRRYGWILSRKPELSQEEMDRVFAMLHEQGYNPEDFEMTLHL